MHKKHSQEQNAEILLENTPIRWDPPSDYFNNNGGAGIEGTDIMVGSTSSSSSSSPRGPEGSDGIVSSITSSEENSKVYCKSQNGVFGSPRNGGVVVRYQYELTVDRRLGEEWTDAILPNLEGGISDSLLPVLFEDECIPSENFRSRRRRRRDREERVLLSTLGDGDQDDVSSRGNLRGGEGARRLGTSKLEVIVGVDSDPRDFPARDKGCQFPIPYEKSTCYVMEGAMTVYFTPDYSVFTYVQGVQFSTLNTIRDGMAYGHLSEVHPSILGLKLMDSSYSLAPLITPELQEAIVNQREKRNANIAAAILVPLLILCCCGCCFVLWKRRPNDVDDLHDMLDDMFLPFVKSKIKSMDHENDGHDRESLHNPIKHANNNGSNYYKNSKRRSRQGTVNSSRRSGSHSASADAYLDENNGVRTTSDDEGLDTSAKRRMKSRKDKKKKNKKKSKKKKKKSKHRSRDVNFDSTDTDNTDTDENTAGRGTSSSSTDDNNSTTSSGSRSSRSSTTSSDRGSTTEGTSTSDDEKETTSTSTSDDDKETTTSTSTSDDDKSSSSGDSEKDDDFDINSMASSHSNFMLQRRNLRRRSKGRDLGPTTRAKNPKSNLVILGGTGEDDNSVMTGMTGATGTHSMASAATAQAKNNMVGARRELMNVGGGGDTSVMTGIMSAATNRVANITSGTGAGAAAGLHGEGTDDDDDEEVVLSDMTDIGETGQIRPPSPTTFSYIPKSSMGGGAKSDD